MSLVDFAIITALAEEFEVLRNLLPPLREQSENATVWYRTRLVASENANSYEVVAAFQNQMGPLDAQLLTTQLIERWDPAYIILVGIAGSFGNDVRLGDVIVSQQTFYYDLGKATPEGLLYRPQGYPSSAVLIRQLEALRLDKAAFSLWQTEAKASAESKASSLKAKSAIRQKAAKAALSSHKPEIHFGTVASGSQVIADKRKKDELLRLHGKIIGTEMEAAGMLHAAFFHKELTTPAVLIKGISDGASKEKDQLDALGYWRDLAKENSARLAIALIQRGRMRPLRTDQFTIDVRAGSPASAREVIRDVSAPGTQYLAFPQLVAPSGPLTELMIRLEPAGAKSPRILKMVVQYHGTDGKRAAKTVDSSEIQITGALSPAPIRAYVMLSNTASQIRFRIKTSGEEQTGTWEAQSEGGSRA